jgi:hypothetical protein
MRRTAVGKNAFGRKAFAGQRGCIRSSLRTQRYACSCQKDAEALLCTLVCLAEGFPANGHPAASAAFLPTSSAVLYLMVLLATFDSALSAPAVL